MAARQQSSGCGLLSIALLTVINAGREKALSEDILKAALVHPPQAETLLRQGLPELEIVKGRSKGRGCFKGGIVMTCRDSRYREALPCPRNSLKLR